MNERAWKEKFSFYEDSLQEAFEQLNQDCGGFLPALLDDAILRDRYSMLMWMSGNQFADSGGHFGGEFRRLWFSHLGGHPLVQSVQQFERKVLALVSRARRLSAASFQEGLACL